MWGQLQISQATGQEVGMSQQEIRELEFALMKFEALYASEARRIDVHSIRHAVVISSDSGILEAVKATGEAAGSEASVMLWPVHIEKVVGTMTVTTLVRLWSVVCLLGKAGKIVTEDREQEPIKPDFYPYIPLEDVPVWEPEPEQEPIKPEFYGLPPSLEQREPP
jgi:hypothetical protein